MDSMNFPLVRNIMRWTKPFRKGGKKKWYRPSKVKQFRGGSSAHTYTRTKKRKYYSNKGAKALALVKRITKSIETKHKESAGQLTSPGASDLGKGITLGNITCVAQGDDVDEREGNKITCKSFTMNWRCTPASTTPGFRLVILWVSTPDAFTDHAPHWYDNAITQDNIYHAQDMISLYNTHEHLRCKVKILYDKIHERNADESTAFGKIHLDIQKNCHFDGDGDTQVELKYGMLCILLNHYDTDGTPAVCSLSYRYRMNYTDM